MQSLSASCATGNVGKRRLLQVGSVIQIHVVLAIPVADAAAAATLLAALRKVLPPQNTPIDWDKPPGLFSQVGSPADAKCTYTTTTGYEPVACAGSVVASACLVKCADQFSVPLGAGLSVTCPSNGGVFQFNGCYPNGCGLPTQSCNVASDCCEYYAPNLTTEQKQVVCVPAGKAKGTPLTCTPFALLPTPKTAKTVPKAISKVLPAASRIAIGVAVPSGAVGGITVLSIYRYVKRKKKLQKHKAATSEPQSMVFSI